MSQWKLYENPHPSVPPPQGLASPLEHNPSVVAVPFDFNEKPLSEVAEAASALSLRPVLITTKGLLLLIEEALGEGLVLRDLSFSGPLLPDEADAVNRVVLYVRTGGSLEPLRTLLTDFVRRLGVIVSKATFWVRPGGPNPRIRIEVHSNGIVYSTGERDSLSVVDMPLSSLGRRSNWGANP
jgi:hypothetical protein